MLDAPVDAWYAWLGLGVVSVAVAGVALGLPTAPPPTAAPVADAVDSVASSPHEARTTVEVSAERMRLRPDAVALRTDGGTAHARFAFGPVTPVGDGRLGRVLRGRSPDGVFATQASFATAVAEAQNRTATWRPAPNRLAVVRAQWGEIHATLVG